MEIVIEYNIRAIFSTGENVIIPREKERPRVFRRIRIRIRIL